MTKKTLPKFNNEQEEHEFWQQHDSTDYIDWSNAQTIDLPNLRPSLPVPD